MFRRLLASSVALAGLALSAPVLAADMGYGGPQPYVQPVAAFTNWSGFYIGANAGYGWGSSTYGSPSGVMGGLQAGYNFQFNNPFVVGLEADFDFAGVSGGGFSLDNFGTVRARAGFTFDRVLFYATGGFAYGQGSFDVIGLSSSSTQTGWTVGAGLEMALDRNWSGRFEYLYYDLGASTFPTIIGPQQIGYDGSLLRLGVNYRF